MPRANRHCIPGYVWHLTHRCHKKEFLLKFAQDRHRYLQWLFEDKKRFGLNVLNYIEIKALRERYSLIDYEGLRNLPDFRSMHKRAVAYGGWIEELLKEDSHSRDEKWVESVAVGSEAFVRATKEELGFKAKGREVIGGVGSYELRESPASYRAILGHENDPLRPQNGYFWDNNL
jgi:hypothetical protein